MIIKELGWVFFNKWDERIKKFDCIQKNNFVFWQKSFSTSLFFFQKSVSSFYDTSNATHLRLWRPSVAIKGISGKSSDIVEILLYSCSIPGAFKHFMITMPQMTLFEYSGLCLNTVFSDACWHLRLLKRKLCLRHQRIVWKFP